MKKLLSLLMVVVMLATLAIPVFAEETGSITINNVNPGTDYSIYKILDLESYDTSSGAYSYKVNSSWAAFFATDDAKAYFAVDTSNYATWIAAEDDATVAAFAKLALAYAKANSISATEKKTAETDATQVKFDSLALGYYLVDSGLGALCGLTTTNADASITEKNSIPTIVKHVKEDATGDYGSENSADIGQDVEYRITINVHTGTENLVLHDEMGDGLTFKSDSVKVVHVDTSASTTTDVPTSYYSVTPDGDDHGFKIVFTQDFCDHLDVNDRVIVTYSAMLNRDAVIAGAGNVNTAYLTFGDDHESAESSTVTYTYSVDIIKTDSQNTLIDGAVFKIYDAANGGNEVEVVPLMEEDDTTPVLDAEGNPMYRRARADETGVTIAVKDGRVTVVGFDNGEYYLEEVTAPEGYNMLAARQKFVIADSSLNAVFNDDVYAVGSGVQVVNKSGTMLPETGSFGTAMFIAIGSLLAVGTGVLLVTRKRMSKFVD